MKNRIQRDFIKAVYCKYNSLLPFLPVFRDKITDFIITEDDDMIRTACIRFFQNGSYSITLNKNFITKYNLNSEDIMWLIAHEISHYLLGHFDYYSDRSNFANFVFDTQVNSLLYNINSRENIGLFTKIYKKFYDRINDEPKNPLKMLNILLFPPFKKRKDIEKDLNNNKLLSIKKTERFIDLWFDIYSKQGLPVPVISARLGLIFDIHKIDQFYFNLIKSEGFLNEDLKKKIQNKYRDKIEKYLETYRKHGYFKDIVDITSINEKDINKLKLLKKAIKEAFTESKNYRAETEREVFFNSVVPFYSRKQIAQITGGYTPLFFPGKFISKEQEDKFSAIYIDFSGSTNRFKAKIYYLLYELRDFFKGPYFLFSTKIKEITLNDIKRGNAISGGTDIDVVLEHINENKFKKALIITDGYYNTPKVHITAEIYEILIGANKTHSKLTHTGKLKRSWLMQ